MRWALPMLILGMWQARTGCACDPGMAGEAPDGSGPVTAREDCAVEVGGLPDWSGQREALSGGHGLNPGAEQVGFQALADSTDRHAFQQAWMTALEVERREVVLAGWVQAWSTCGFDPSTARVYDRAGTPHFVLDVVDTSLGCEEVCDQSQSRLHAVAIEEVTDVTFCVRRLPGCP